MGYGRYIINGKECGYLVPDRCNRRWCWRKIDRGLAYLCGDDPGGDEYGCGGYFCSKHLAFVSSGQEHPRQLCHRCLSLFVLFP